MSVKPLQLTSPDAAARGPRIQPPVRLGLSRVEAAEYIGVGVTLFDQMAADGRMPGPKVINSRKVWDRDRLGEAFAELPEDGQDKASAGDAW